MSAELLRRAAEQARETATNLRAISQALTDMFDDGDQGSLQNSRIHDAVAALLDNAAEDEEMLQPGGDLGPQHDTFMRQIAHQKALTVARAYLGEPS